MGDKTAIEWTDASLNPIRARERTSGKMGFYCLRLSDACKRCYAAGINRRLGTGLDYVASALSSVDIYLDEKTLLQALRWKRRRFIFMCSMTDLFGSFVPDWMVDKIIAVAAVANWHTYQILTKRADRMNAYFTNPDLRRRLANVLREMLASPGMAAELAPHRDRVVDLIHCFESVGDGGALPDVLDPLPLPNVWLGVTAEHQDAADDRIHWLIKTPAAIRFISWEPGLGQLDLQHVAWPGGPTQGVDVLRRGFWDEQLGFVSLDFVTAAIDWIIAGGESGPIATPLHVAWVRALRDQAVLAGVAFFFKQWGTWGMAPEEMNFQEASALAGKRQSIKLASGHTMIRMGKKVSGRLLDGREHNDMPRNCSMAA
jgi:protein gp37